MFENVIQTKVSVSTPQTLFIPPLEFVLQVIYECDVVQDIDKEWKEIKTRKVEQVTVIRHFPKDFVISNNIPICTMRWRERKNQVKGPVFRSIGLASLTDQYYVEGRYVETRRKMVIRVRTIQDNKTVLLVGIILN